MEAAAAGSLERGEIEPRGRGGRGERGQLDPDRHEDAAEAADVGHGGPGLTRSPAQEEGGHPPADDRRRMPSELPRWPWQKVRMFRIATVTKERARAVQLIGCSRGVGDAIQICAPAARLERVSNRTAGQTNTRSRLPPPRLF